MGFPNEMVLRLKALGGKNGDTPPSHLAGLCGFTNKDFVVRSGMAGFS